MENIKDKILAVLNKYNYKLYSVKYKTEFGARILEVLIDESLTHDELEPLHHEILDAVDKDLNDKDFLEVSTLGAERPIENIEEASKAIGSYIYIISDFYKGNATITNIEDDKIVIEVIEKTRKKNFKIRFDQLSELRYAVKF